MSTSSTPEDPTQETTNFCSRNLRRKILAGQPKPRLQHITQRHLSGLAHGDTIDHRPRLPSGEQVMDEDEAIEEAVVGGRGL